MQKLKFLGIRVIYISQGIDSDCEQADALVAVHGLIDSLYLKELAKKVRRGIAGQMDRGFSTGAMQYGYDKIAVFDPSGAKDADGRPILLGRRIQVNEEEAAVIRRIFAWAADGVGVASIVDRLNREGIPGAGGGRWNKTAESSPTLSQPLNVVGRSEVRNQLVAELLGAIGQVSDLNRGAAHYEFQCDVG
jgi:hypothetical protein